MVRQRSAQTAGSERQLWLGMALGVSDRSPQIIAVSAGHLRKVWHAEAYLLRINRPVIP
jgi:hypothetical protein